MTIQPVWSRGAACRLVRTKLYVPQARQAVVPRARLADRLGRTARARLTLVSGPAGFGKTTLLARWARSVVASGRAVAWVSLEETEQQAASFWTYVVTALDAAAPGVGVEVLPLLQAPHPPMDAVLATLLNELGARSDGVDLVLDDYHLADGPGISGDLAFLLEHLPPHVHLVISTRADPALPLARLRALLEALERSNLFVVRLDDSHQWYRYHHLFADVLRAHLLEERPGEVAGLHRRAAEWYRARAAS